MATTPKKTTNKVLSGSALSALQQFNNDFNAGWTFGTNWTSVGKQFETFINKYLFPKINETLLIHADLGNRFDWLAKEEDFIGQYSEEYVILDSVPISMNLSKSEELMLKRNYPKIASKLYGTGILKKQKFTLNNNDVRLNFSTLGDAVSYALSVYKKRISDINVSEEREIKGMLVDYALNVTKDTRPATSAEEVFKNTFEAILNIQNNSDKYNEANKASGGELGRYTTSTKLDNTAILTNDKMKTYLLDTKLAGTYQAEGLDLSNRIISFDDLGGVYRTTADVEVASQDTINYFRTYNDYQIEMGDTIPSGVVITFDVSSLTDFTDKVVEIKPETDQFAFIFDINKLRYKRYTKDMLKTPFYNGEFDEVTYWLHYYSSKSVSPFYNSIKVGN